MFTFFTFIILIGVLVVTVRHFIKKEDEEHERRMEFLKDNLAFQERILSSMKSPIAATAVGGAATMLLLDNLINDNNFDQQTIAQMQDMDLHQLQKFAIDNNLMNYEEINRLMEYEDINLLEDQFDPFNPYTNPGTDLVIDEYYHGIDRGLDNDHFHDDFSHDDIDSDDFDHDVNDYNDIEHDDFNHDDFDNSDFGHDDFEHDDYFHDDFGHDNFGFDDFNHDFGHDDFGGGFGSDF